MAGVGGRCDAAAHLGSRCSPPGTPGPGPPAYAPAPPGEAMPGPNLPGVLKLRLNPGPANPVMGGEVR